MYVSAVASHRPSGGSAKPLEPWIFVVIAATLGLLASLVLNVGVRSCSYLFSCTQCCTQSRPGTQCTCPCALLGGHVRQFSTLHLESVLGVVTVVGFS